MGPACRPGVLQQYGQGGSGQGGADRDQGDLPAGHAASGMTVTGALALSLVQQSGGGSGLAKAAGAVARASTAPASVITAAKMRLRCFMVPSWAGGG
jgi:hypothetical protein